MKSNFNKDVSSVKSIVHCRIVVIYLVSSKGSVDKIAHFIEIKEFSNNEHTNELQDHISKKLYHVSSVILVTVLNETSVVSIRAPLFRYNNR